MAQKHFLSIRPLLALPSVVSVPELLDISRKGSIKFMRLQSEYRDRFGVQRRPSISEASRWFQNRLNLSLTEAFLDNAHNAFTNWKGLDRLQGLKAPQISLYLSSCGLLDERRIEEGSTSGGGLAGLGPSALLGLSPFKTSAEFLLREISCSSTRSDIERDLGLVEKHYKSEIGAEYVKSIFPFIHWIEADHYGNPAWMSKGENSSHVNSYMRRRAPVVCVMGHIDHGKTTLLDTLQESNLASKEAGLITQSIRAFTVDTRESVRSVLNFQGESLENFNHGSQGNYPEAITFIDTPGHKAFGEMRLHGQRFGDCVLLLISLEEGVKPQTIEVLNCARQTEKPVVIALNKIDSFTDPRRLTRAIRTIANDLGKETSVDLKLLMSHSELDDWCSKGILSKFISEQHPTQKRQLRCPIPTVCISGKQRTNVDLLLELLRQLGALLSPSADHSRELGRFQARIIETSLDMNEVKKRDKRSSLQTRFSQQKALQSFHVESTGDPLILNTIVRSGGLRLGMPFVADMTYGTVTKVTDPLTGKVVSESDKPVDRYRLNSSVAHILPGASIGISGLAVNHIVKSGSHVIEVESPEEAKRIATYRHHLRAFIEMFPQRTSLLRPSGLPHHFKHLGDYGQLSDKERFESPEYRMAMEELKHGSGSAVNRAAQPDDPEEENLEWVSLQDPSPAQNQKEFDAKLSRKEIVTVLLKTDTWHSARILAKEIPKLGTLNTIFHITGLNLGSLKKTDISHPHLKYDVIITYRVPPPRDPSVEGLLERSRGSTNKVMYFHSEILSEVVKFLKQVAVLKHREYEKKVKDEGYNPGLRRTLRAAVSPSSFGDLPSSSEKDEEDKHCTFDEDIGDEGLVDSDLMEVFGTSAEYPLVGDVTGRFLRQKNINAKYRGYSRDDQE